MLLQDSKVFVTCPVCHTDSILPSNGTNDLKINQVLLNLFDVRKELITHDSSNNDSATMDDRQQDDQKREDMCPDHSEPLRGYCDTCSKVICRDCTMSKNHANHSFSLISECYSKHLEELRTELAIVKKKMADMTTAMTDIVNIENEVNKREETIKDDIECYAQQIMELVHESKEKLFSEVESIACQKKGTLAKQKTEAGRLIEQLRNCEVLVDDSINNSSKQCVLMEKKDLLARMRKACIDVDPSLFKPIEDADMRFGKNLSFLSNEEIGLLNSKSFDKSIVQLGPCVANELSSATLTLVSSDKEPFTVSSQLVTGMIITGNSSTKCSISEKSNGKYDICYNLTTVGEHRLVIKLGGFNVTGSPFSLVVPATGSPTDKDIPIRTITELSQPRGIAICDNNDIIITENTAHCVTIMNKEGRVIQTVGTRGTKGNFVYPQGVTINSNQILYVTDEHRLHKVNITDSCIIKTIGKTTAGNGSLEFRNPHDVAVQSSTGHVFVVDSGNNRIQVFKGDLTYLYTIDNYRFARYKQGGKCFNEPIGVAFDKDENLYISEYLNHCITKVTVSGHFLAKIGSEGSNPGHLYGPSSITINNNYLYVAELGIDRVSVFNVDGSFVHCFWNRGKEDDSSTHSIAVDTMGNVYITDNWNSVVIY